MSVSTPDWGSSSRFYLPNEDAAVLCAAVKALGNTPERPVFVGGSGMLLLEAMAVSGHILKAVFTDISAFQCAYFALFLDALSAAASPEEMRSWYKTKILPDLQEHYQTRGQTYSSADVMHALEHIFRCRFMFDTEAFFKTKSAIHNIQIVHECIVNYLSNNDELYDFIYLSNVPDYLKPEELCRLVEACRRHAAPVYFLLTSACAYPEIAQSVWREAGFAPHACCIGLNLMNRALGSHSLRRKWNRPGSVYLLRPFSHRRTVYE